MSRWTCWKVYWFREAAAALSYDTRVICNQVSANISPLDHKPKDRPGSSSDKTNLFPALRLFQVVSGLVVQDHRTGTGHGVRVGRSESAGLFRVVLQAVTGVLGGVVVLCRVGLDGESYSQVEERKVEGASGFVSEVGLETTVRAADLGGSHCSSFFLSSDIVIGRLNSAEVYKL